MRIILVIPIVLLGSLSAQAQTAARHTPWPLRMTRSAAAWVSTHKEEMALDTLMVAARGLDAATTTWALNNGARETNPILGSHPSMPKLWSLEMGFAGVNVFCVHKLMNVEPDAEHPYGMKSWAEFVTAANVGLVIPTAISNLSGSSCTTNPAVVPGPRCAPGGP